MEIHRIVCHCCYGMLADYVNSLQVIKVPLENNSQSGGPMLDGQELRYIFGNLPPIHIVHTRMRDDLLHLAHNWMPDASIGEIILKYVSPFSIK